MNNAFFDQLGCLSGIFEQWGDCEKTVVACALAKRVPWPGLKLLQRAVDAALSEHGDDENLEKDANDETILTSLLAARIDDDDDKGGLSRLLQLVPLLRADNTAGKEAYVGAAPGLVRRCVDVRSTSAPHRCRQLLSLLLVHPALTQHDQRTLTQWLKYLEYHISGQSIIDSMNMWKQRAEPMVQTNSNIWGSTAFRRTIGKNLDFRGIIMDVIERNYNYNNRKKSTELDESFSKNGRDVDISLEGEKLNFDAAISQPKSQRSNSLTPPSTNILHMSSSAENLSDEPFVQKPRSFSLSSEHSLSQMRPISIMYGTTGSETRLDDLRSNNVVEYPGMSMVAQWLKSLRLHKYVWLFTNISYEQMMAIDEDYLEKLGVTKGARHKLLLSIHKLNERRSSLEAMESELASTPSPAITARVLEKLRGILISPMPPSSDLPAAIVRVLELASKSLGSGSVSRVPGASLLEEEDVIVDPMSLHCWLVEKALHHESFCASEVRSALRSLRHRLPPRQFFLHVGELPRHRHNKTSSRWRATGSGPRRWLPPAPRPKSHSYPPHHPHVHSHPPPHSHPHPAPPDDYSSLDALCLQMTEQAIN